MKKKQTSETFHSNMSMLTILAIIAIIGMIIMGTVVKYHADKNTAGQVDQDGTAQDQPVHLQGRPSASNIAGKAVQLAEPINPTPYHYAYFGNSSNHLEMYEPLGVVKGSFSGYDIPLLHQGQVSVHGQTVTYYQNLLFNFQDADGAWSNSGNVAFAKNRQMIPADYLYFEGSSFMYQYAVNFAGDMSSNISNATLIDFIGLQFNLLGENSRLISAQLYGASLTLKFQYDNPRFGIVEFTDSNYADENYYQGVYVNGENMPDARVRFHGQMYQGRLLLTEIDYQVKANAIEGLKIYVPYNGLLSGQMEKPQTMLSSKYDLIFQGALGTVNNLVEFNPSGDDAYYLKFTNTEGLVYNIPFVDASAGLQFGSENDDLWLWEYPVYQISENDYILLGDVQDTITRVVSLENIDTLHSLVTFKDASTGTVMQVSYIGNASVPDNAHGNLVVGGATHQFYIYGNDVMGYNMTMDQNADGNISVAPLDIVVRGGGRISVDHTQWDRIHVNLRTPESNIESMWQDLDTYWDFVALPPQYHSLQIQGLAANDGHFQLEQDQSGNMLGRNVYGTLVTLYYSQTSAKRLTLNYPISQVFPRVAVRSIRAGN